MLADRQHPRRLILLAALMREARPEDVWTYVTPREVSDDLAELLPRLGRQRAFWKWLFEGWRRLGLLS